MTRDEAIERLIEIAKGSIGIVDGEWGCCHGYDDALKKKSSCMMHKEALEIAELIEAVRE